MKLVQHGKMEYEKNAILIKSNTKNMRLEKSAA